MDHEPEKQQVRWKMHLPVPPEAVYSVIDSDEGRASFWAESAVEKQGIIEFRFINGVAWNGRIMERKPPGLFVVDYMGGPAQFELSADSKGGTDLVLTQTGLTPEDWAVVHAGWLNVLFPLKARVVFGVDLRNHDPNRTWDMGYADQ